MARAVGIDLDATSSIVAVLEGGEPIVIPNAEGVRTTPSVITFTPSGEVPVGEVAKRQTATNSDRAIRSVKRHTGTDWKADTDGKDYRPQQISAFVLQKLKRDAEAYLSEAVTNAVIIVPTYFSDVERQAIKEIGETAGPTMDRTINEPTAAVLVYGLDKGGKEQAVPASDPDGGTSDASLFDIADGVFEVKATNGDNRSGGDDWDAKIVEWLVTQFKNKHGVDLSQDKIARQRLQEAVECAEIELFSISETSINLPCITASATGPLHLDKKPTRTEFQRVTQDLLDRCCTPFNTVIKNTNTSVDKINQALLIGGPTRISVVADLVRELTGGREPNKGVSPDEVVALGVSLQVGVLKGEVKDVLLLDVTPLSLGIRTKGGMMTKIIERNITIPMERSEVFTTVEGNRPSVIIQVYQGEREFTRDNKSLGDFELTGLLPASHSVLQIEVTFDIDTSGIVHVHAKDLATSKEQSMTVTGGSALAKEDIDRMVCEVESHAEEDCKRRESVDTRNEGNVLVFRTEKLFKESADSIDEETKAPVVEAVDKLKEAPKGEDNDMAKATIGDLNTKTIATGRAMYAVAQAKNENSQQASENKFSDQSGDGAQDDVIDAETVGGEESK